MEKEELGKILIVAFEDLSVREALKELLNSELVRQRLKEKHGSHIFNETLKQTADCWEGAWKIFEKHYGINTHGDHRDALDGEFAGKSDDELQSVIFEMTGDCFRKPNGVPTRDELIDIIEKIRELKKKKEV